MSSCSGNRGATLVELLAAMVVLGLASGGIFATFYFSRQVSYRTEGKLIAQDYAHLIAEQIRLKTGGGGNLPPNSLAPGIYLDSRYDDIPGNGDPDPLDFDPDGRKNPCRAAFTRISAGPLDIPLQWKAKYNLRWRYYVEDKNTWVDAPCGPGPARGRDFDGNGTADLLWTKIVVDWDPPQ